MIRRRGIRLALVLGAALLAGCAGILEEAFRPPPPSPSPSPPLPVGYLRDQALRWERADDLPRALLFWQILSDQGPADSEAPRQLARLQAVQRQRSEERFWAGVTAWSAGQRAQAQAAWIAALRLDPGHAGARRALGVLGAPPPIRVYRVHAGDSFSRIAERFYRDASKGFLVALFNDWPLDAVLPEGLFLRLPVLEEEPPPPRRPPNLEGDLARLRKLLQEGELTGALEAAEAILKRDPGQREALQLRDRALLGLGLQREGQGDVLGAWEMVRRMSPAASGYAEAADRLQALLQQRAEEHYKNGVKFFLEEDLEKAIEEWQTAVVYRPDHPQAVESLREARRLLKQLQRQP